MVQERVIRFLHDYLSRSKPSDGGAVLCFQRGDRTLIPTGCRVISRSDFMHQVVADALTGDDAYRGVAAVLSYDDLAAQSSALPAEAGSAKSVFFTFRGALEIDSDGACTVLGTGWTGDLCDLATSSAGGERCGGDEKRYFALRPFMDDQAYLGQVDRVQGDILAGRYYELNLLRRFEVVPCLPSRSLREGLVNRWVRRRGAFGVWAEWGDRCVVSLSPERVVGIQRDDTGFVLTCQPIKGTAPRLQDAIADMAQAEQLALSPKDRAELAMIIDLTRNDLFQVSLPHSVQVVSGGHILTLQNVHHLVGTVTGRMRQGTTFGDLLRALLPAGSITGAPKREVIGAIREIEAEQRGFFMGTAVIGDSRGSLDANVLIRTVDWRSPDTRRGGGVAEFAAGSGIVLDSVGILEAQEIAAKCRILE